MSLHTLAHQLQSAGRGEDKVLVHMTPGEVKGLQALAMSQGGSLSINPQTGLPEAGILSSLLPMIAGFFLGPAGLGLTAMQSAVAVGALGTAATGSLGKGFMMGLGAYGGAGLGSGLVTAGTPAAAPTTSTLAGNTTLSNVGTTNLGTVGGTDTFANLASKTPVNPATGGFNGLQGFNNQSIMAPNAIQNVPSWAATTPVPAPSVPLSNASEVLSKGFVNPPSVPVEVAPPPVSSTPIDVRATIDPYKVDLSKQGISDLASTTKSSLRPEANMSLPGARGDLAVTEMSVPRSPFVDTSTVASPSNFDKAMSGAKRGLGSWEGAKEVWNATPTGTGYGLAATGMSVLQSQQEEAAAEAKAEADAMAASRRGNVRPYEFSTELTENAFAPRESTAENRYFVEPRFIAQPIQKIAKEGGIMSLAVGGPVEQMAAQNSVGNNTMYPQSQLQTSMYSNPMVQRPMPTNVIQSGIDAPVGMYTGEQRMAGGGTAYATASAPSSESKYSYDPATMQYTQANTASPSTNNFTNTPAFSGMFSGMNGLVPQLWQQVMQQKQAQQPNMGAQTSGGIAEPYMPPSGLAAAPQQIIPNIPMQPQQNIDRQLGLEAFYPMMEQQLALKGSNLQAQGYANGGVARFGGGGTMQYANPEAQARHKYAAEHGSGIIKTVSDDDWNTYKKLNDLSFKSAASAAPTYKYNAATMQYTDNAGKVTGGMQPQFIPMEVIQPEQQIGMTGYQGYAEGGTANGGYSLGSYSDGGRLLRGPGDGVSDSIPASIGDRQPARLADGEFVVPARIVSEIGNGSTEAGARKLYAMMDRVQKARKKTVGKNKVAVNTKADKLLPA